MTNFVVGREQRPIGDMAGREKNKKKGSGLLRGLGILEQVVTSERPISQIELAQSLGLPKPTVHRLCRMLQDEGFLQPNLGGSKLIAGPRLVGLAHGTLAETGQRTLRHALLEALSNSVGETCNITIPDGTQMLYFDRVESKWPLRLQLPIGSRVPLHCTASGKLFLSSLPGRKRQRLLGQLDLTRYTENTRTDPEALERDLRRIRAEELGTDDEEFLQGMVAVAVPIKDRKGRLYATLAIHAPVARMSFDEIRNHAPAMRRTAAQLSDVLEVD